jgi:ABC-type antimicrobial peptide transport system permease subunit
MDNLAYIPIGTSSRRLFNRNYLSLMSVKLRDAAQSATTQQAVERVLRERHSIAATALPDFRVSSPGAMIARVANVDTTLRKALLWVGVLALVIGGAMIANLMFAATSSRRREIAIRRAVGATRADILRQIWFEAVLVALVAAIVGEVIGLAAIALGARMMGFSLAPSWPVAGAAIAASVAIGMVAGFLPARRAAALHPSVALRES